MGLFDKKYCDVCGEKIGFLGNRKLEDGNLCKDCAKLLSPFFDDRRSSTIEEIKAQLEYREANKQKVAEFNPTKVIGGRSKIYIDEDKQLWFYSRSKKWEEENPDIIEFSQVTGCDLDIRENEWEKYDTDKDGKSVSYRPPRYERRYDFNMTIHVNSPWFDEIDFKINDRDVDSKFSVEYRNAEEDAEAIRSALTTLREHAREQIKAQNAPKTAVTCPSCNATTLPNSSGCCEYCGGAC